RVNTGLGRVDVDGQVDRLVQRQHDLRASAGRERAVVAEPAQLVLDRLLRAGGARERVRAVVLLTEDHAFTVVHAEADVPRGEQSAQNGVHRNGRGDRVDVLSGVELVPGRGHVEETRALLERAELGQEGRAGADRAAQRGSRRASAVVRRLVRADEE